jgi:hypothetical protein
MINQQKINVLETYSPAYLADLRMKLKFYG